MARKSKTLETIDKHTQSLLADAAARKGLSQNRLAEITGMSQNRIGIIFRLETPPATVGEVCSIAHAIGKHGSEFIEQAEIIVEQESASSSSSPVMLSEVEAYKIAEELDRKLRAGMTPEELGLAAKTREIDPLDTRGEESQIPPDWDE